MKGTVYLYEVSHPDYPTVTVPSIGPDSATVEAARRWGVPELWGRLAGYCTVRRGGRAARPRCTRCGREFGTDRRRASVRTVCARRSCTGGRWPISAVLTAGRGCGDDPVTNRSLRPPGSGQAGPPAGDARPSGDQRQAGECTPVRFL